MNKIFRIKLNLNSNTFVVCHEKNKSRLSNSSSASPKGTESLIIFITQHFKFKKFIFLSSVISLFTPLHLFANPLSTELPKGADVVIGNVTIDTNQNLQSSVMNVNQASQRAVVNWNSFNVGSDATVNFNQPNANASILNRVNNQSPSQIFGKINANGEVILMNPAGIYFGKGSSLNVGAITATTHSISNDDFMKGLMTFDRKGSTGSIINDGSITANFDSYIALLAPEVRNSGLLIAKMGTVVMASGEKITLNFDSDHHLGSITSDPSTIKSLIENNYAVEVEGGRIILSANAINTIAGSLINQNGLLNAGSNATQLVKQGGQILLLADTINLNNGSQTLANGLFGGGEILIGGSWQNSNPTFMQALKTSVADLALIQANATGKGDGGTIVIWSDITNKNSLTNVQGTLEAKGGLYGGDGGKIETSGHQVYLDGIKISASATQGSSGTWLIDPYDVVIGTSSSGTAYSNDFVPGTSSYILASNINTSLNAGTNVSISTGSNAAGTLTLSSAISKTTGGDATLSLTGGTININAAISGSGAGKLGITLDGISTNFSGQTLTLNGGDLSITNTGTSSGNIITGSGNFTKDGAGTLTISNSSSFTGTTTINQGRLTIDGLVGGNIVNNAALTLNSGGTYASAISGTGGMTVGGGNLYLTGTNTYTGDTNINSGANLYIGNASTTGSLNSSSRIVNAGTLYFNRSDAVTIANRISGAGVVQLEGGTDVTFTGDNDYTGYTNLYIGSTLSLGNGGTTGSINNTAYINAFKSTLKINRSDDVAFDRQLAQWGNWDTNYFIQQGSGTTTLSNTDTNWFARSTINNGALTYANSSSFGNSGGTIVFNGGSLKYIAANKTDYSSKFSTTANQQYSVDVNGQAITWATALNSSGGSLTVSDSAGSGSLNLTANNTYSGATNINGGNLTFSGSGAAASSTALNIGGSASYTLSDTTALSNTGSMALSVASGGNLTLSANRTFGSISGAGNIALGVNTITTGSNNNSTTYSGVMSGTGALSKTGTGILTLSGSNTYSGGTTISNGTIKLGSVAGLGTSNATVSSGASLDLNGQTAVANNLSLNGTGVSSLGALYNSSTSVASTSGNITLAGNTTIKSLGDITLNSTVQSSNNGSLTIDATGKTVTLNGLIGADPTTLTGTSSLNPSSVTITGDTINLNNDITGGSQTFNGAINIGDNGTNGTTRTVLAVGTSPSTTFNGTINDTVANTHTLNTRAVTTSINNTPMITFNGNVGQVKALAGMETTAMYQPSASGSVYGTLPTTIDTSSNYSGTVNVNGAFKTTGDQTFTGKTLDFATNQPATVSGNINIYGYSATSGGANTSTINIPGFKVTSDTQTIKGLSADQLLTVTKTIDKTIDPNFVATVSGSGGSAGTNNAGRVKFDAGIGSKIIKDIAMPKSTFSLPIQSGGSLKPSINIGEVYVDGLSNNIGAPVITNNFSQPGAGNAFIRQPKDE
ncbi:filamentous hemagglutinin N-terminal domain-containing protein [Candidatus Methylopumilus universalis]|uniref:beta strand repeat-containing protein n=1 Tax=Candidatus Methylopumilus universalis TaxID=2588536 RepID=UPI00111FB466|nr:filamentous hemagglutinin N-terminal domain-containing protein [Candidatus Methylopumilus universalis]QDC89977.1 filamentous hemagglutinin N-terminal domain-containing protein [Candidatus Methylopumilus universalis]